ncbi:hypothetical protein BT96DRAFT_912907 [Gymnopus androsaceus JB14]|uniref:Uncharacterized protein n=1 Tax=Gymnopus androsaceus JB14 TaxID=1447944 RepID=A0A6A4IHE2_9AGAR|nr:hypothetical protein BT96DRAFT_912907 [Gymnopus androsaceus JB14]
MASNKKSPASKTPDYSDCCFSHPPARVHTLIISKAKAGNDAGKGTFPARVQSAAATNVNKGVVSETPAPAAGKSGRKSPAKGTRK